MQRMVRINALSNLLRPASTSEPKTIWTEDHAEANESSNDMVLGLAIPAAPVPSAPLPPTTPTDLIIPTSSTPSTISSISSVPSWNSDRGLIRRKRTRRRIPDAFADDQLDASYRHDFLQLVTKSCSVLDHIVLELFDVQRMDWTMIAEPVQRLYGIEITSAGVLGILQQHGRVQRTQWWD
ncbi:hypothetical protein K490DRAFT_58613 [Saccharata proteae CBS 121410]|uniref:Uncharacterized protein n=1 Tax=Saccharata proteae CBS 121410 TaxID=1314787 RepID=A0A9P4HR95_9PEZI|nr:hypothetical protein K490DRAFT_58613 [Saccharata proteae CBS 121410]